MVKSQESQGMLYLIGGFKLAKGLLLVALGVGALKLLGQDAGNTLTRLAELLKFDPGNKWFQAATAKLGQLYPKLSQVAAGSFCYGAVFCVEGVGLILRKRWAEWLTVITTGSFIPFEIFEIVKHHSAAKIAILALNVAILIYLIVRLRRELKPA